jgi:hypothetical protein
MGLRAENPIQILEGGSLFIYDQPQKQHSYIMTVDVCRGKSQDYSTFSMIDISTVPFKQVAVYRNNEISPLLYPQILVKYGLLYNEAYIVVENNDQGCLVTYGLHHDMEYENLHMTSTLKSDSIGVEMTKKTKRLGCSGFKDVLETGQLTVVDENTILEISTFEAKGTSYEASDGNHDDIVMNLVMFGYFLTSPEFRQLTDLNIRTMMFNKRMEDIQNDIPAFGFVDDGLKDEIDGVLVDDYLNDRSSWGIPLEYDNGW